MLITIDKLDKIGPAGVDRRAARPGRDPAAVEAFEAFLVRPMTLEYNPYGERQIRKLLPEGAPDEVVAALVGIGEAVAAAAGRRRSTSRSSSTRSSCAAWATTPARSSSSRTRPSTIRSAAAAATTA